MTRGHSGGVALLCLVAGALACAKPPQTSPQTKEAAAVEPTLECALSVAPRLRVGEPVMVRFRLTNRTAGPLYVLEWHSPLEGLLANHLRVTRDGVDIPYQGPMLKRGDPGAEEYVAIAPGASAEAEEDASLAYDFQQPGRYTLAFPGPLWDVALSQADVPRPLGKHQAVPVRCPVVETQVVAP